MQELREKRCAGSDNPSVEAVRVRFEGNGDTCDEEWVPLANGDIRVLSTLAPSGDPGTGDPLADEAERTPESKSDEEYWRAAGVKASDFTAPQAELLQELLEYRLQPGTKGLELGAGAQSLLPIDCLGTLFGVGLISEHLEMNGLLTGSATLDLNSPSMRLPFDKMEFDAVVCNVMPYLHNPVGVLREARRCLKDDGLISVAWTSNSPHTQRMARAWRDCTGSQQVALVKELFKTIGLNMQSLRVDVSGPTDGEKLFLVSASPSEPKKSKNDDDSQNLRVTDAVGPLELISALKDKSKKRLDARRQKEHDEKPFRVKVVSPPPERLLDETFYFHPRTHNGDKVQIEQDQYVVSRTTYSYSYREGRYRLDAKILEVQKRARYETNEKLNSLVGSELSNKTEPNN